MYGNWALGGFLIHLGLFGSFDWTIYASFLGAFLWIRDR